MNPPCSTAESAVFSRQHENSWHGQSELLPERSLQVVSLPRTDPFLIPSTTINVSVNTVNGGGWSKVTQSDLNPSHPEYYRDNHDPSNSPRPQYAAPSQMYNIQYDGITAQTISGVTTGLTGTKSISANVTYHVKIAIADYGDAKFDSGVFIKASIECPQ